MPYFEFTITISTNESQNKAKQIQDRIEEVIENLISDELSNIKLEVDVSYLKQVQSPF